MAFSDYKTIAQVQEEYNIKYLEAEFIEITDLKPSALFVKELKFSEQNMDIYTSESSRCENIIYPILREVYKNFIDRYTLWSHKSITYDAKLNGTPDYLFSTKSELGKTVLGFPIIVIVEAKKNDFSEGWGQCLAELIAVQKLNKAEELPVYGIVTDGELWQFGKLVSNEFTKSKLRITITDLDKIFGTISFLLSSTTEADLN
ncbi:MAG: hypothetical protein O4861_07595 [Trichodesmium sp. St16_bin4-tuft]|uniref:Uncharacterized protein n=1 Tax=Trichodesmium erythraeum (strain IMS101) TaxID=203124 RepID=Q110I8_TRIEI|nr:hypothetical protein [Trichodesmium erythraeum GBRTRLIN201]MDE5092720.1 hypothetical protein [Trichodesmium sp. St11_bin5]MDE5098203.1 hypothetical protein [Trichodesmium sp. St16_bin4-tuft]MDT9339600.1 hypothetical protein [Trichodesmium erythraeum 21-75]